MKIIFISTVKTVFNKQRMGHTVSFIIDRYQVFNATFHNISDILWMSDLLVKETGPPRENHRPTVSH